MEPPAGEPRRPFGLRATLFAFQARTDMNEDFSVPEDWYAAFFTEPFNRF